MVDWPTFSAFNGTLKRETLVDDSPIPDPVQPAQPGENNFTRVERDILKVRLLSCYIQTKILIDFVPVGSMDDQIERRGPYGENGNVWWICRRCKISH
jgi:hypothetical protein